MDKISGCMVSPDPLQHGEDENEGLGCTVSPDPIGPVVENPTGEGAANPLPPPNESN